jgi:hypothetical protein
VQRREGDEADVGGTTCEALTIRRYALSLLTVEAQSRTVCSGPVTGIRSMNFDGPGLAW